MCIPIHHLNRRGKTLYRATNLSLVVGLILWAFVRPSLAAPHGWLDAVCGLLMGFYIGANLLLMRGARRCETAGPQQL